jgi:methionyl-tRNA formyltransferase
MDTGSADTETATRRSRATGQLEFPALKTDPSIPTEPWLTYLEVKDINRSPDQDKLREVQPDLILLAGAPIITQSTIRLAKVACLNAHCGISPRYAGNSPVVWAVYERQFDQIGYTVHLAVPTVDGGPVLFQERIQWDPGEPLGSLWPPLAQGMYDKLADIAKGLIAGMQYVAVPQENVRVMPPAGYLTRCIARHRQRQYLNRLRKTVADP